MKKRGKRNTIYWIIGAIIIAILLFAALSQNNSDSGGPSGGPIGGTYCTLDQRNADVCTENYHPVCGWFNPQKVICAKYPCALTFGNSCFACMDENILYYTKGECPK